VFDMKEENQLGALSLFLILALFTAFVLIPDAAAAPTNIQVPLLTSKVTLDGRITQSDEWADTQVTRLSALCRYGCSKAPVKVVELSVQAKHDDRWIYFLYKVDWSQAFFSADDHVGIEYYWSQNGYPPWKGGDLVEASANGQAIDSYYVPEQAPNIFVQDVKGGGQNNVVGKAGYNGTTYIFEFRRSLNSGDGKDPVFAAGRTFGVAGSDGQMWTYFGHYATGTYTYQGQYAVPISLSICPCAPTTSTTSTTTTSVATQVTASSSNAIPISTTTRHTSIMTQTAEPQPFAAQMPFGLFGVVALLVLVGVVSMLGVFMIRRKGPPAALATKQETVAGAVQPAPLGISTGYPDLDRLLAGGLPEGYAILILSASWDERDLLLRRIIASSIQSGRPTFFVSNDINTTQELGTMYAKDFYAYSALADKMTSPHRNLSRIPGVGNLSEFTISLSTAMKDAPVGPEKAKLLVVDVLSDLLLRYKALTTVRWLSSFLAKRKVEKFTVIATLNPSMAPKEETQPISDLFDGVIEIFEKALGERTRRFLVIKKMHGRRYIDSDLMLDRDKLF
jgi:KaiC/GvpD/RAD55 family RecA-like ATPase